MSLYERDYARYYTRTSSEAAEFVKRVYVLFALSLLSATIGAWAGVFILGPKIVGNMFVFIVLAIIEFALVFIISSAKAKEGLNTILLFIFTFISGLTLTPLLHSVLNLPSGAVIVAQAFTLTTVAFAGLSVFAFTTKKDFGVYGKALFVTLLIVCVASIIGIFVQNALFHLVLSSVCAILFSFYIIYDTQKIVQGEVVSPTVGAIMLYLDFINLFTSLLRILSILNSRD